MERHKKIAAEVSAAILNLEYRMLLLTYYGNVINSYVV